jgi:DNA-binding CsgD family transcriptional regulator
MIAVLGFGLCLAFLFYGLYFVMVDSRSSTLSTMDMLALQSLFFIAYCACHALIAYNADLVLLHRNLMLLLASGSILIALFASQVITWLTLTNLFLLGVPWIFFAFGLSGMYIYWLLYFNITFGEHSEQTLCLSFLVGSAFLCVGVISRASINLLFQAGMLAVIISTTMGLILFRNLNARQIEAVKKTQRYSHFMTTDAIAVCVQGGVYGYAIVTVFTLGVTAYIPAALSLLVGSVIAYIVSVFSRHKNYSLSVLLRRILPILYASVLLVPLLELKGRILCCCLIIFLASYMRTRRSVLGIQLNTQSKLNPLTHGTLIAIPYIGGVYLGFLYAIVTHQYLNIDGIPMFLLICITSLVIALVLFLYKNNTLGGAHLLELTTSKLGTDQDCPSSTDQPDSLKSAEFKRKRFWIACDSIAERGTLTKREIEVFHLLVKGRNAEYISNKMFISMATAKTHIYHIYAKLGVNSQQELISLVDTAMQE